MAILHEYDPVPSVFSGKVFAVGGYVRDEQLGIKSKDLDIVIERFEGAQSLTEYIHRVFPEETSNPLRLGESYPIWHLSFKDYVVFKGDTYQTTGAEVDFADTQKESFPDPETRQRITTYGSIHDDCLRRDFTTNMLLRDLTTGELRDLSGTSLADIKAGVLRGHPEVSLNKTFSDDPLRMIRLIRFHCKFGWRIPFSVLKMVKENAHRISIVSGERIREELVKIITYGKLSRAIRLMDVTGLLRHILPEVSMMKGVQQGKANHAEGDAFVHTLLVVEQAQPTVVDSLSALLHDVGKTWTRKEEDGKISFHGHESLSAKMSDTILRRLKFDLDSIEVIKKVIDFHLRAHCYKEWGPKAVRKFIRDCGPELDAILRLMEADVCGCYKLDGTQHENYVPALRESIRLSLEVPVEKFTVLDGDEIKELLSLPQGKEVGRAIKFLRELEDDHAVKTGTRLSKEHARELLKSQFELSSTI